MSLKVEVVADGRMNGCEFLQTLFEPEPVHGFFSSPKGEMGILGSIVFPAPDFLGSFIANDVHCRTVGLQPICYDDLRLAISFHRFFQEC